MPFAVGAEITVLDATQVARLVALGMLAFVAVTDFRLWRMQPGDRPLGYFAGWAVLVFSFVLASYIQQTSHGPATVWFATRFAATCLTLLAVFSLFTARDVAKCRTGPSFKWAVAVAGAPLPLIWAGNLVVTEHAVNRTAFDGSVIASRELGVGVPVLALLVVAMAAYIAFMLRSATRAPNPALTKVRYASFALLLPAAVNDILFHAGHLHSLPVLDFALALIVLVHGGYVFRRAAQVFGAMEALVSERTRDLAQSRASLSRSVGELRRVLAALPDTVCVLRDGRIDYVNDAGVEFFERPLATLRGAQLTEFAADGDEHALAEAFAAMTTTRDRSVPSVLRMACGDSVRTVELAGLVVEYEADMVVLAIIRDVTERNRLLAELQTADRLASVGKLAAGVAHEINNPLTYVLANLFSTQEVLAERGAANAELLEWLDDCIEGVERIARIVRDLRSVGRADEERCAVHADEVLRQSVNMARVGFGPSTRVIDQIRSVPPVLGQRGRLGQVFLNLLVNAGQALPDTAGARGEITVSTRTDAAGNIVIEIADTGAGIAESVRGRIFDPFVSSKPMGVGSGLGLAICHGIVTGMGGAISLEPRDGGGTVARVVLPPAELPAADSVVRLPIVARHPQRLQA